MTDQPPDSDPGAARLRPSRASAPVTPRWVKVFGIVAVVVLVLFVVALIAGGGGHGPGRHTPGGGDGGHTPPAGVDHGTP